MKHKKSTTLLDTLVILFYKQKIIMKKCVLPVLFFIVTLMCTPFPVSAQSEADLRENESLPVIEDVEGLRADFEQKTQNPRSKEVEFVLYLNSQIDSDRVKITWDLIGSSVFLEPSEQLRYTFIERGQSYQIPIKIKPVGQGVTEIRATVEAFKADATYVVSVRKNFATNSDSEVLPLSDEYKAAKLTVQIVNTVVWVVAILVTIVLGFFGIKLFLSYLNRDDVKEFDKKQTKKPLKS